MQGGNDIRNSSAISAILRNFHNLSAIFLLLRDFRNFPAIYFPAICSFSVFLRQPENERLNEFRPFLDRFTREPRCFLCYLVENLPKFTKFNIF